jgi:hypothetical protein
LALWIRDISEWNSITAQPSLDKFLAQGIGPIAASRLAGLTAAVANFAVVIGSVILVPFLIAGGWARRHSIDFLPWFVYTFVVFAGATLLYPLHVPGGAFIHSAIGLAPHAYILALEGIVVLVGFVARRRPSWRTGSAAQVFVGGIVVLTMLSAVLFAWIVERGWDATRQPRMAVATELDRIGVPMDDRILSIDAGGIKYWTGRPGIVTPDDPIETIEEVARAYGPRWLILERNDAVRALAPVLTGLSRPAWIGAPVFRVPSSDGGPPRLALYPVCTVAGDQRCATASTSVPVAVMTTVTVAATATVRPRGPILATTLGPAAVPAGRT